MGSSILELVLGKLREAQFSADAAYPGQKFPEITHTVAAVHIARVDQAKQTVTVGVIVVSPASAGGTACEREALRAAEVLSSAGAECIQNGCRYDRRSQVYTVEISASFPGTAGADSCTIGPRFQVCIGQARLKFVTSFEALLRQDYQAEYAMGEELPVGFSRKRELWEITLRELVPDGTPEGDEPEAPFTLTVFNDWGTESFQNCRWTSVRRERTREGLRKTRTGIAALRKELKA